MSSVGKSKAHKKKRISKHVLESQRRQEEERNSAVTTATTGLPITEEVTASDTNNTSSAPDLISPHTSMVEKPDAEPKRKKKNKKHTRDPSIGNAYLSAWKHRASGEGVWKFNKNTQTWLIRHMYDCDVTPKGTFSLLVGYIEGLKGETLRKRVEEEAVKRALRYKNWEKAEKKDEGGDVVDKCAKVNNEAKENTEKETKGDINEVQTDETPWENLSAHDKRNEYKRARKIIDALKATTDA